MNIFYIDDAKVHTIITNFIDGNDEVKAKIQVLIPHANRYQYFIALQYHYEVIEVNGIEVTKEEIILTDLFYSGKKNPKFGGKSSKES